MFNKKSSIKSIFVVFICSLCTLVFAAPKQAAVDAKGSWVRATVTGQKGTGGFMTLTAREDLRLVRVSSPVAGVAQIHEMHMNKDNVMEMRAIEGLNLAKGKPLELKPGGYHLMLEDLKKTLDKNTAVPLTLYFKNSHGQESQLDITAPVGFAPPDAH